jgi:transcriptional regulator GlxA family with amidase domain
LRFEFRIIECNLMIRSREHLEHRLTAYLDACYRIETPPRVSELADSLGVSSAQLSKTFHRLFGSHLSDYLKTRQVEYAEVLLRQTTLTMTKVAYMAGFGTRRTFFRTYRRVKGETPDHYRVRMRENTIEPECDPPPVRPVATRKPLRPSQGDEERPSQ